MTKNQFMKENKKEYTDVSTVESMRNDLTLEEFPEGPYGSVLQSEKLGKSIPWRESQDTAHRFQYENKDLHNDLPRDFPQEDPQLYEQDEEFEFEP